MDFFNFLNPFSSPTEVQVRKIICQKCPKFKEGQKDICGPKLGEGLNDQYCGCYMPFAWTVKLKKCPQKKW
jgi:hypothetical protein